MKSIVGVLRAHTLPFSEVRPSYFSTYDLLLRQGPMTGIEIADALNLSESDLQIHLARLQEAGELRTHASRRGILYNVAP